MNLFGLETVDEQARIDIARRSLNNLLTSYADEADIFNEIIQNAFDAVYKAVRDGLYGQENEPLVTIVVGRRSNGQHYLFVADNGIGMHSDVAKNLTVPGYSFGKIKGKTLGYKGVGASYVFAASQRIALRTIDTKGSVTEYTVRGSYEWIKNAGEPKPTVDPKCEVPEAVRAYLPEKRGTCIYFQFHEGIKPKNLNNLVLLGGNRNNELKNWMLFFASKTAVGSVNDDYDHSIKVKIVLDLGDEQFDQSWILGKFDKEANVVGYPFPHRVLRTAKSVDEILATSKEQQYKHTRKYQAVHKRWTAEEIIDATTLESDEKSKLLEHLDWADGYLCYSTDVMKEINSRMGGRAYLIRHGIRIAVDGIPQGRNVDLSLTSNQGLDRQSHIVLSFRGLELDTGRKISADELIASAISKVGRRIIDLLKEFRWTMKKKDRPEFSSDLETWRSSIEF